MKQFILGIGISLLAIVGTVYGAQSGYRLAGMISSGETYLIAIVETPDSQQHLVRKGESLGEVEVLDIAAKGVFLKFPDGERWLQLASGEVGPAPLGSGVSALEFKQRVYKSFRPARLATIQGMEQLRSLPPSARILAISDLDHTPDEAPPAGSLDSIIQHLHSAMSEGTMVRITVAGNGPDDTIYLGGPE